MAKHDRTLRAVFAKPTRANVRFDDAIALLKHVGAVVGEDREGSRVGVSLAGRTVVLHKPHPGNQMRKRAVEVVRDLLTHAGEAPP